MKTLAHVVLAAVLGLPTQALSYEPVFDENRFLSLIDGRELRNFFYGIRLQVLPEGTISGGALGYDITGTWSWQDGYFCREMEWGGDPIPYNCQLVEARGEERLRFTVDRGAGDSASFRLE